MIHLTTGLPGSGKSLSTLVEVKRRSEAENRRVFYWGIEGLTLDWERLDDPQKWHLVPPGSIVVIDECQRVLPTRGTSAAVPVWVEAFSTHRHKGVDVYLVTQDPMQFDHFVRRLVGVHWHCVRPFGLSYATIWQFEGVQRFEDWHARKNAVKRRFAFDAKAFGFYRSAEVHTHVRRLPWAKLAGVAAALGGLAFCAGLAWYVVTSWGEGVPEPVKEAAKGPAKGGLISFGGSQSGPQDDKLALTDPVYREREAQAWIIARVPRYEKVPESAPVYDELTKPKSFPRVAGCALSQSRCLCYSQQGTVMQEVDTPSCQQFVFAGRFDPYRADPVDNAGGLQPASAADGARPLQGARAQGDGVSVPSLPNVATVGPQPTGPSAPQATPPWPLVGVKGKTS